MSNDLYAHTRRRQQVCRACPTQVGSIQASLLSKTFHNQTKATTLRCVVVCTCCLQNVNSIVRVPSLRPQSWGASRRPDRRQAERLQGEVSSVESNSSALLGGFFSLRIITLIHLSQTNNSLSYLGGIGSIPLFTPMRCQCAGAQHV